MLPISDNACDPNSKSLAVLKNNNKSFQWHISALQPITALYTSPCFPVPSPPHHGSSSRSFCLLWCYWLADQQSGLGPPALTCQGLELAASRTGRSHIGCWTFPSCISLRSETENKVMWSPNMVNNCPLVSVWCCWIHDATAKWIFNLCFSNLSSYLMLVWIFFRLNVTDTFDP